MQAIARPSDAHMIVIPRKRTFGKPSSKKQKILHESGPQELLQPSALSHQPTPPQPEPYQPGLHQPLQSSQGPRSQLSPRLSITFQRKNPISLRKHEAVNWFLQNAPKATEWRQRQTELGLVTVKQYEMVVRSFIGCTNVIPKRDQPQGDRNLEKELVDLAKRFVLPTKDVLRNTKLQRSFARFQTLILLSYCIVVRKLGVSDETFDQIIQHIPGREAERRRLLQSALWVNRIIVNLVSYGWTICRATEFFFIGVFSKLFTCKAELTSFTDALSVTYLTSIHNDDNSQCILEHFKTDEFVKDDYSDCLRPEYTIPGLVQSLLDACSTTANKLTYGFQPANKGNADKLGLIKYAPPLVIPRIMCQTQLKAYIKFMLLLKALLAS